MKKSINQHNVQPSLPVSSELLSLPAEDLCLVLRPPLYLTKKLWRALAGNEPFRRRSDIADDLCAYVLFAVAGTIGFDRQRLLDGETLLFRAAFETGSFLVRLTGCRQANGERAWTLSLPEEPSRIPS